MRAAFTALALAVTAVSAQAQVPEYGSSLNMTVDPGTVDDATKAAWCNAQSNTCNTLCDDSPSTDDCNYDTLDYECLCSSNDSAPGLQYYEQTMPTLICKELFSQCIQQHVGDARGQRACKANIDDLCGTLDPNKADVGSDDDEEEDDGDEASETTATTATTAAPTATDDSSSEDSVTTTDSDDIAGPTPGPKGVAAMAALGLMVALV